MNCHLNSSGDPLHHVQSYTKILLHLYLVSICLKLKVVSASSHPQPLYHRSGSSSGAFNAEKKNHFLHILWHISFFWWISFNGGLSNNLTHFAISFNILGFLTLHRLLQDLKISKLENYSFLYNFDLRDTEQLNEDLKITCIRRASGVF